MSQMMVAVPDIGGFTDVAVIDVLVKAGEVIAKDTPLITLETEKAAMDVPSPEAGKIVEVKVKQGGKVSQGSVILVLDTAAAGVAAASAGAATPTPPAAGTASPAATPVPATALAAGAQTPVGSGTTASPGAARPSAPVIDEPAFSRAYASPSVRKFARELGADLGKIKGTGPKQRITQDDVKAFVKQAMTAAAASSGGLPNAATTSGVATAASNAGTASAAASPAIAASASAQRAPAPNAVSLPKIPEVDFAYFGAIESQPLTRIQKISGARLQASWINLPHVTQHDEADITELEAARVALKSKAAQEGVKLTPLAFIVKACCVALKEFPRFNSSLDAGGANLILKKYINVGFAADTPNGLVVPVIHGADQKNVYEISRSLSELAEKARAGKLGIAAMQGGTFTISSLGGIGGTAFTPIINAPEVAILGVSKSAHRPVFVNGEFVPRLMLPLSLSYDHRVVDGAAAARFVVFLSRVLGDVKSLL